MIKRSFIVPTDLLLHNCCYADENQQGPKQLAEALLSGLGLGLGRVSLGHAEGNNSGAPDSQPVVF